jgi:serine/threonine-protein kinase
VGQALVHLHEKNMLMLDLTPSNVMIRSFGVDGDIEIALIDFGISVSVSHATMHARCGIAQRFPGAGTLGMMSPEQERGEPVRAASDTFAFGMLAKKLLRLDQLLPPLPTWALLIDQCTHNDPRERPKVAVVVRELSQAFGIPISRA